MLVPENNEFDNYSKTISEIFQAACTLDKKIKEFEKLNNDFDEIKSLLGLKSKEDIVFALQDLGSTRKLLDMEVERSEHILRQRNEAYERLEKLESQNLIHPTLRLVHEAEEELMGIRAVQNTCTEEI